MHQKPELSERFIESYRAGDWHECISQLRVALEVDPFAMTPRQLLASLYLKVDNPRHALIHYEKLLPLTVGGGDLFRGLTAQKHTDRIEPAAGAARRFAALHRLFRLVRSSRISSGRVGPDGLTPAALLALPQDVFEWLAEGLKVDAFDPGPAVVDAEAGTCWAVVMGCVRWRLVRPGGDIAAEGRSAETDFITFEPGSAPGTRLHLEIEFPAECLRFDAALLHELRRRAPGWGSSMAHAFTDQERAMLPSASRRAEDLDWAPSIPAAPPSDAPPRLPSPELTPESEPSRSDTGDWVEFGTVALPAVAPVHGTIAANHHDNNLWGERTLDLNAPGPRSGGDAGGEPDLETPGLRDLGPARMPDATGPSGLESKPVLEIPRLLEPGSEPAFEFHGLRELGSEALFEVHPLRDPGIGSPTEIHALRELELELSLPSTSDSFPSEDQVPSERRRDLRVSLDLPTRVVLLGLSHAGAGVLRGRLFDLSAEGAGMQFESPEIRHRLAALEQAAVTVELTAPDRTEPLRLAGRVRWLETGEREAEPRLGIEFLLLTEMERAAIAALVRATPFT